MLPSGAPELDAVTCADVSHCVAVGGHVALVSSDGGTTWSLQPVANTSTALLGAACATSTECVSAGVSAGEGTGE